MNNGYFVGYFRWQPSDKHTAEVKFFKNKENARKFAKTVDSQAHIGEIVFEEDKNGL